MTLKNYWKPTPKFWRKIGDCLLGISTFLTGSLIITNNQTWALLALGVGVVGKFLTNFFSDEVL